MLISAIDGVECSASRPGRFTPGTHWIRGWVGPRAGLDNVKKKKNLLFLSGMELRFLGRPVRSKHRTVGA
jgi:hypothetical protein